jgi:hypothetical protein
VLYYLSPEALPRAVETLACALEPGGLLVLGSAVDEACFRWGLPGGAETAMAELSGHLRETARITCHGADWGENCLIVSYCRTDVAIDEPRR